MVIGEKIKEKERLKRRKISEKERLKRFAENDITE